MVYYRWLNCGFRIGVTGGSAMGVMPLPAGYSRTYAKLDTPLSEPFQKNVPDGKLFTPAFVAQRLDGLLDAHAPDGELSYLDWAGEPVPW